MAMSTHVEGARLAPLWNSGHVEKRSQGVDQAAKDKLPVIWLHHLGRVTIHTLGNKILQVEAQIGQRGDKRNTHS